MLSVLHSSFFSTTASFSLFFVVTAGAGVDGASTFSVTTSDPEAVAKLSSSGASAAFSIGESILDLLRASTASELVIKSPKTAISLTFDIILQNAGAGA